MYTALKSPEPLPDVLVRQRHEGAARRRRIGDHEIDPEALHHFNELLERLDLETEPKRSPLDSDQIASAARDLAAFPRQGRAPPCIQQRMRRAAALDLMLGDPDWQPAESPARTAAAVVEYLRAPQRLIPKSIPVVGHLDDAILVEQAWRMVAEEVASYLDFCRLRHIEAALRGELRRRRFGFTRAQWQEAARAEAAWIEHCQRVGLARYLPEWSSNRFRVA